MLRNLFPRLTDENHKITSPRTIKYNCVAWAAEDTLRWWQPGAYWPVDQPKDEFGIGALILAFAELGYEECENGVLENGFEKVAIYGSGLLYTHAARQLSSGEWTSKIGQLEDIIHSSPDVIAGGDYGEVVQFMRRARPNL